MTTPRQAIGEALLKNEGLEHLIGSVRFTLKDNTLKVRPLNKETKHKIGNFLSFKLK